MSWLALKNAGLPVGSARRINFSRINREFLQQRFRPSERIERFFSPFRTSGTGWVSLEHSRTTLQRMAADTFSDCFVHDKGTQDWGWASDAVDRFAQHLGADRVPAAPLAAWLFMREGVVAESADDAVQQLYDQFGVTEEERRRLFDATAGSAGWSVQPQPIGEQVLLSILPPPPDARPTSGASLHWLQLTALGPVAKMEYRPSQRVNLLTGDNNLGKTLLLEAAWSALTGTWHDSSLLPLHLGSAHSVVEYKLVHGSASEVTGKARYVPATSAWALEVEPAVLPGLVLFARSDGSYSFHDPVRGESWRFARGDVWEGLRAPSTTDTRGAVVCEGALRDLLMWQLMPRRYEWSSRAFRECLSALSPDKANPLTLADPQRLPNDEREVPAITTALGQVPITHASAGIQRMAALAYMLVWAWSSHERWCRRAGVPPERRLVLLLDEVEAHLHPKWQRTVIPSMMKAVTALSAHVLPQVHVATHSPLVVGSMEPGFEQGRDSLHHLRVVQQQVSLVELPFVRQGRFEAWLSSEAFDEVPGRTIEAEEAIAVALELMRNDVGDLATIQEAHRTLVSVLAQRDNFWPRWLFWAEQRGATT